jgi:hypothetical protein
LYTQETYFLGVVFTVVTVAAVGVGVATAGAVAVIVVEVGAVTDGVVAFASDDVFVPQAALDLFAQHPLPAYDATEAPRRSAHATSMFFIIPPY